MRRFLRVWLGGTLLLGCAFSERETGVSLVRDAEARRLSAEERLALRGAAEEILASCNFNSDAHGQLILWPSDPEAVWSRYGEADHVLVRYSGLQRIETVGGAVELRELLLPLPPGEIPAQPLTRRARDVTVFSKCSGTLIVDFSCSPLIEPLMPASYGEFCDQYRDELPSGSG